MNTLIKVVDVPLTMAAYGQSAKEYAEGFYLGGLNFIGVSIKKVINFLHVCHFLTPVDKKSALFFDLPPSKCI